MKLCFHTIPTPVLRLMLRHRYAVRVAQANRARRLDTDEAYDVALHHEREFQSVRQELLKRGGEA